MPAPVPELAHLIGLVSRDELARALGYSGAHEAFRTWCAAMRITPVPGRVGWYDPRLVRRRLDEAQGLLGEPPAPEAGERALSLVEQRRARRGAA
jgi:hypothetical protein